MVSLIYFHIGKVLTGNIIHYSLFSGKVKLKTKTYCATHFFKWNLVSDLTDDELQNYRSYGKTKANRAAKLPCFRLSKRLNEETT